MPLLSWWLLFEFVYVYFHLGNWNFQALSVLSKALETDRTSVVLWIVYLVVYYGSLGSDEKDDIFLYAVCFSLFSTFNMDHFLDNFSFFQNGEWEIFENIIDL